MIRALVGRFAAVLPRHPSIAFLMWRDSSNPEGGGSELFVERVAEHLATTGWDVTICASAHGAAANDEVRRGVRIRRRGGRFLVYPCGLAYLLSRRGRATDVVVDVQNGVPFFAPLVRRSGIVNLTHHVHRREWQLIFPGLVGRIGWWLESRLAPRAYRRYPYVTVSRASCNDLVGLGVDIGRISIVNNGIDVPRPATGAVRAPVPTVCLLGRLVPHKQVEHALDVAAKARTELADLRVDVVGDGYWRPTLAKHADRLGIASAVTFHGHVSEERRDAILGSVWVLLVPSMREGWGIAIMEAAAHGVPAIAYRTAGGVCESIVDGETGWLVDDLDELRERTVQLLVDPATRERMAENARARAAAFDWATSGRRFAEVLSSAAPVGRSRRRARTNPGMGPLDGQCGQHDRCLPP